MRISKYNFFLHFKTVLFVLISLFLVSCNGQTIKQKTKKNTVVADQEPHKKIKQGNPFLLSGNNTTFPQIHTNLNGMVREFVRTMYQDTKGNYWFGTNGDGVIRYDGTALEQFTKKDGFGGTAVRGILEDKNGVLWFGTSGGLTKYDGGKFTNYSEKEGLIHEEIWSIALDQKGDLWMGTVEGVSVFNGETFTAFPLPKPKIENPQPMLSPNRIGDILIDKKGAVWFVTDGYGITVFDGKEFSHFTKNNGLTDNNVADLLEDKQGKIWIGTYYGGVSSYDGNSFTNYTKDNILEGIEAYNFMETRSGELWFSVEHIGVYHYNKNKFTKHTAEDGLTTNGVQSIFEDRKGNIWFGTWKGLSIYKDNTFSNASEIEQWAK